MSDLTRTLTARMSASYTRLWNPWNGSAWSGRAETCPTQAEVDAALAAGVPPLFICEVLAAYEATP